MSDQPRFADGSLAQFGIVFAALVVLCLIVAGLSGLGMAASATVSTFLLAAIAVCTVRPQPQALPSARGVSISMESLSAFGFFGIAGGVFVYGFDGLAVLIGLGTGLVISLLLIAPRLAASPARSFPDYLSLRYRSEAIRYCALAIMTIVTILFVAAQFAAAGVVAEYGLGLSPEIGGLTCAIVAIALILRGGDAGQILAAILAILGIAIATMWLLSAKTGVIVPHVAYGGLFNDIAAADAQLAKGSQSAEPFAQLGRGGFAAMILCLGLGSAVMPALVSRAWTPGSPARTQAALRRGLILFVVIATAVPALGVLARAEVMAQMAAGEEVQVATLSTAALVVAGLAEASDWLIGLLSLVGLLLAILAANAAITALASACTSRSTDQDRTGQMSVSAIFLSLAALAVALLTQADVFTLGLLAFSLSGASIFAPLAMGLLWRRTTTEGALVGMLGGFVLTVFYSFVAGGSSWLGVTSELGGVFGIVLSVFLTFAVSIATAKPAAAQTALVK